VLSGLEARLFRHESAVLHADLADAVEAEREADVHLRDLMGLPPGPEPRFSSGGWPVAVGDDGDDWKRRSLEIALRSAEYEAAERRLELEIRRQYPDLGVGPGYGTDQGDRRFLFDVSIPIPLWNANAGAIAEAEAIREGARTRFEAECACVVASASRIR
jgi:outer membrane protein TolC